MRLEAFWRVVGSPTGQGRRLAEWQGYLGDEFERVEQFLRPTDSLAQSYPCPHPGGEGCPREVIHHSADHIVAACRDVPPNCDLVRLEKTDLILHELDLGGFCRELAAALGLAGQPVQEGRRTWSLGILFTSQHGALPVLLGIPPSECSFSDEVLWILNRVSGPFILLTSTVEVITTDLRALVLSKGGHLAALGGLINSNGCGKLEPIKSLAATIWPEMENLRPEKPPEAMVRKLGRDWEITFRGEMIQLPDELGVRYLLELLRAKGKIFSARELYAGVTGKGLADATDGDVDENFELKEDQRQLRALAQDRAKAEAESNAPWLKEIDEGTTYLQEKLSKIVNLRGNKRPRDAGERSRKAVSKAYHRVFKKIKDRHPKLAEHLKAVSMGYDCWYQPQEPVDWIFELAPTMQSSA